MLQLRPGGEQGLSVRWLSLDLSPTPGATSLVAKLPDPRLPRFHLSTIAFGRNSQKREPWRWPGGQSETQPTNRSAAKFPILQHASDPSRFELRRKHPRRGDGEPEIGKNGFSHAFSGGHTDAAFDGYGGLGRALAESLNLCRRRAGRKSPLCAQAVPSAS